MPVLFKQIGGLSGEMSRQSPVCGDSDDFALCCSEKDESTDALTPSERPMMLPETLHNLTPEEISKIADKVRIPFFSAVTQMAIRTDLEEALIKFYVPLAATLKRLAQDQHGPLDRRQRRPGCR